MMQEPDGKVPCVLLIAPRGFGKTQLLTQFTRLYQEESGRILAGGEQDATGTPQLYFFKSHPDFGRIAVLDLPGEIVTASKAAGELLEMLRDQLTKHPLRVCGAIVMMKPPVRNPMDPDARGSILIDGGNRDLMRTILANADRVGSGYPVLTRFAEDTGYAILICSEGALGEFTYAPGDFPVAVVANFADLVGGSVRKEFLQIIESIMGQFKRGEFPDLRSTTLQIQTRESFSWLNEVSEHLAHGGVDPASMAFMPLSASNPPAVHHDSAKLPLYHAMSSVYRKRKEVKRQEEQRRMHEAARQAMAQQEAAEEAARQAMAQRAAAENLAREQEQTNKNRLIFAAVGTGVLLATVFVGWIVASH